MYYQIKYIDKEELVIYYCYGFSHAGRYHTEHEIKNEDFIVIKKVNNLSVVVLCDGAGSCCYGAIAAKIVAESLSKFFLTEFRQLYNCVHETSRRKIIQIVNDALMKYANLHNIEMSELATTFMVAALEDSGKCICVHLGDGVIFQKKKNEDEFSVVSSPRNGITDNLTYLTSNCNLWRNMRYYKWNNAEIEKIVLLTDGAAEVLAYYEHCKGWCYKDTKELKIKEIERFIKQNDPQDDFSYGIISKI